MVTKSMARTPFGTKLIYRINGECIWSEYLTSGATTEEEPHTIPLRQRAENVLTHLKKGFQTALLRKAS